VPEGRVRAEAQPSAEAAVSQTEDEAGVDPCPLHPGPPPHGGREEEAEDQGQPDLPNEPQIALEALSQVDGPKDDSTTDRGPDAAVPFASQGAPEGRCEGPARAAEATAERPAHDAPGLPRGVPLLLLAVLAGQLLFGLSRTLAVAESPSADVTYAFQPLSDPQFPTPDPQPITDRCQVPTGARRKNREVRASGGPVRGVPQTPQGTTRDPGSTSRRAFAERGPTV
jgi:hypothetical protein